MSLVVWWSVALLAVTAAVAAWLPAPEERGFLVADEVGTVSLLDPDTGEVAYSIAGAVVAPDRSRLYRARAETWGSFDGTVLEQLDPQTGEVVDATRVAGRFAIRVVSPFGGAVALMPPRRQGAGLYVPEAREYTSINVVWDEGRPPRNYTLQGNYEPETFSTDEDTLFLIEFWPADAPDRYYVRQLDLESGEIRDAYSPEVELNPEMRGRARAQVMAPDGLFLYTLYTLPAARPVHDAATGAERWAFVHAVDLEEERSFCIFLPVPFGTGPESAMSLAIDGSNLFVVDAGTQWLGRIDTRSLQVEQVATVDKLRRGLEAMPVAVSERFLYVGMRDLVLEVDRAKLEAMGAFYISGESQTYPIEDLDVAPDGQTLRIAHGSRISVLDLHSGEMKATLTAPGGAGVSFVGPPVGGRDEFPLECAC